MVIRQLVADAIGAGAALVDRKQGFGILHDVRAEQITRDVLGKLHGDDAALEPLLLQQADILIAQPLAFRPGQGQAVKQLQLAVDAPANLLHHVFEPPFFLFGFLRRLGAPHVHGVTQQPRIFDQGDVHLGSDALILLRSVWVLMRQVERSGGKQLLRADGQPRL